MTKRKQNLAIYSLWHTFRYKSVDVLVTDDPRSPGKVIVAIGVVEK
jgi:hypothetical protein